MATKGIMSKAGNSIKNHPHLLGIILPQPLRVCLPYGALILKWIKTIIVQMAIAIQI